MDRSNQQSGQPLLEVRELSLRFDDSEYAAVDRVSFSLTAGSTLGLVGASGAGKSSIARAIVRLVKAESGEILLDGEDILQMSPQRLSAARQRIQLVFQDPSASLSPRRTVEQTLLEPLRHFVIGDRDSRQEKIHQILKTVGLDADVLPRYPHQFSSGQQQRIAIARALVTGPELLIADEAVSSLDVSIQAQILQLIRSLQNEHGITFLFISHDLAVIRQIADNVAVIYRGRLLEQSTADRFFSAPLHPYSKTLLAFARDDEPAVLDGVNWQLERGTDSTGNISGCVYARYCQEKMPICERLEPAIHTPDDRNRDATESHCVKCHLFDGEIPNDS